MDDYAVNTLHHDLNNAPRRVVTVIMYLTGGNSDEAAEPLQGVCVPARPHTSCLGINRGFAAPGGLQQSARALSDNRTSPLPLQIAVWLPEASPLQLAAWRRGGGGGNGADVPFARLTVPRTTSCGTQVAKRCSPACGHRLGPARQAAPWTGW